MKHTDAEIEEAARRFEALAGGHDPQTAQLERPRWGAFFPGRNPQAGTVDLKFDTNP